MERLEEGIRAALRSAGLPDAGALAAVVAVWPSCVGDGIARQAWPLRLSRDGTLRVACQSATWAFELDRMAPDLLAALREQLGDEAPTAIRFAPGTIPSPGAEPPAPVVEAPVPDAAQLAAAAALAAGIEDEELREMAIRAIAASLADRRVGRSF